MVDQMHDGGLFVYEVGYSTSPQTYHPKTLWETKEAALTAGVAAARTLILEHLGRSRDAEDRPTVEWIPFPDDEAMWYPDDLIEHWHLRHHPQHRYWVRPIPVYTTRTTGEIIHPAETERDEYATALAAIPPHEFPAEQDAVGEWNPPYLSCPIPSCAITWWMDDPEPRDEHEPGCAWERARRHTQQRSETR